MRIKLLKKLRKDYATIYKDHRKDDLIHYTLLIEATYRFKIAIIKRVRKTRYTNLNF